MPWIWHLYLGKKFQLLHNGDTIHLGCVASIGGVVVCVLRSVIEQKFQVFGIPLATQVWRMATEAIEMEHVDVKRLRK